MQHTYPPVSRTSLSGITSVRLIAPTDGRIPYIPFAPAGPRIDPPVSEPIPTSSQSCAEVLDPAPVEDPDGSRYPSPRSTKDAW